MEISNIDIAIIIAYLVLTVFIGFWISKKASKDLDSYFLGGKTIPWYYLGVSNASGMFDITGTMWTVSLAFVYGMKSAWLPWMWPVWNQIFLMVFLSAWLRRSNVLTGAEWLQTRFGTGRGAHLSHLVVVTFAVVSVIGYLAYGFKGIGKFSSTFLPWDIGFAGIASENVYALIIMGITTLYVVKGGMYSVVMTELIQFGVMTVSCLAVGVIAFQAVTPELIAEKVPEGWGDLFFGVEMGLDWTGIIDSVNTKIEKDGYSLFSIVFMMMLFKGLWASTAGPIPSYDMQRILATKSPKEAAKMSGLVPLALSFPRYLMIGGLTALALVYFSDNIRGMGEDIDFEMILPIAIKEFIPVGLTGLLLAGLIAAFMSTFAATVNSAPAYIVNDIYKRFINPDAEQKVYIKWSYIVSFLTVVVGVSFGFFVESIDSITKWLVAALFGGYAAPNALKWIWWRFNGYGYFAGMVSGLIASLILPIVLDMVYPDATVIMGLPPALFAFPIILVFAFTGSVVVCLSTPADDEEVLKDFYKKVRPWGFWGPIKEKCVAEDPDFSPNVNFSRDAVNVLVGIVWQMTMVVMPMYLVFQDWTAFGLTVLTFLVTTAILKFNWWDKLED